MRAMFSTILSVIALVGCVAGPASRHILPQDCDASGSEELVLLQVSTKRQQAPPAAPPPGALEAPHPALLHTAGDGVGGAGLDERSDDYHPAGSDHMGKKSFRHRATHHVIHWTKWLIVIGVIIGVHIVLASIAWWIIKGMVIAATQDIIVKDGGEFLLGCKTSLGELQVDVRRGIVGIKELVVHNPPNSEGGYLIRAGCVRAQFSLWRLVLSRGHELEVSKLTLGDIHVLVEFQGSFHKTNVSEVLRHLKEKTAKKHGKSRLPRCDSCCLPASVLHKKRRQASKERHRQRGGQRRQRRRR